MEIYLFRQIKLKIIINSPTLLFHIRYQLYMRPITKRPNFAEPCGVKAVKTPHFPKNTFEITIWYI